MTKRTKNLLYYITALLLIVGYPAVIASFFQTIPMIVYTPVLVGLGMIMVKATTYWLDYVSHDAEQTKDLNYPDPTIIDITGIKYKEDKSGNQ